ncbi:hypothetical protein ACSLOU_00650 [Enterobacter cloacae]|uniref:hypothetical protein n=1 Tax=Enterobacter cloacae TaxID=550 RepID=UPI003EE0DA67
MAFVSVVNNETSKERYPFVTLGWSASGNPRGYLSKEVDINTQRFHFELDAESKQIRLRDAPNGTRKDSISCGASGRNFAFSKLVMREIGERKRIELTLKDDGWYYGSYGNDE